jgi:ethanolamine-phosphate cytidylyltransferase
MIWVYADVVCDLFHYGHVEFFRQARALGDRLIVGVVGDDDVMTYKPAPMMSFQERLAVVAACRHVDRVLPEPAPLFCTCAHLDRIGADFACHGDDYAPEDVAYWYADLLPAGRVRTVRYTRAISTRMIVARLAGRLRGDSLADPARPWLPERT